MAKGRMHKVPHRRRREGKTDYRMRLKLLKSRKPRFVVRKSANNIICQIIQYNPKGDVTIASADSRELVKLGWKLHRGNIPAAYLTGLLCGMKAKEKKVQEAVLDGGLYTNTKGSRIYAAVKGVLDAGIKVPISSEVIPPQDKISGKHIPDKTRAEQTEKEMAALKAKILK
jgi:large subunit ribosomal protein L18